jgi:hypothetical protein
MANLRDEAQIPLDFNHSGSRSRCWFILGLRKQNSTSKYPNTLTYSISPQNAGNLTGVMNVSQDSTQQVNLTFTSMSSAQIAIPIENPRLTAYKSTINYSNWDTNS